LATVGLAAAALFFFKKIAAADEPMNIEAALDACDQAANSLDARLHASNGSLVA
jgi:hypothetical protein